MELVQQEIGISHRWNLLSDWKKERRTGRKRRKERLYFSLQMSYFPILSGQYHFSLELFLNKSL